MTNAARANTFLAAPSKLLDDYLRQASEQLARRRMVLGERIKSARNAKRWKQKDLAGRIHVEPQTISNWERGARVPDWDKLELLARELDKPLSYFVVDAAAAIDPADPGTAARDLAEMKAAVARIEQLVRELLGPSRDGAGSA